MYIKGKGGEDDAIIEVFVVLEVVLVVLVVLDV